VPSPALMAVFTRAKGGDAERGEVVDLHPHPPPPPLPVYYIADNLGRCCELISLDKLPGPHQQTITLGAGWGTERD